MGTAEEPAGHRRAGPAGGRPGPAPSPRPRAGRAHGATAGLSWPLQSSVFTYEDKSLYEKIASNFSEPQVDVNESSTVDARSQREPDDWRPAGDVPAGGLPSRVWVCVTGHEERARARVALGLARADAGPRGAAHRASPGTGRRAGCRPVPLATPGAWQGLLRGPAPGTQQPRGADGPGGSADGVPVRADCHRTTAGLRAAAVAQGPGSERGEDRGPCGAACALTPCGILRPLASLSRARPCACVPRGWVPRVRLCVLSVEPGASPRRRAAVLPGVRRAAPLAVADGLAQGSGRHRAPPLASGLLWGARPASPRRHAAEASLL